MYAWYPGCKTTIRNFIRKHVGDFAVEGLKILEWSPSAKIYPEISYKVHDALKQVIRECTGSLKTTIAFGKRWLGNIFANFQYIEKTVTDIPFDRRLPVVIVASGPTLNSSLPWIQECQDHVNLWALPSSLTILHDEGVSPDLTVLTDPGFYAMYHLFSYADPKKTVAMPLSACRGIWQTRAHVCAFSQNSLAERCLYQAAHMEPLHVPSHGTVSGTAAEMALRYTQKEIVFAGLDFCYEDIRSHATPNTFDILLQQSAERINPLYNQRYQLAMDFAPNAQIVAQQRIRTSLPL